MGFSLAPIAVLSASRHEWDFTKFCCKKGEEEEEATDVRLMKRLLFSPPFFPRCSEVRRGDDVLNRCCSF